MNIRIATFCSISLIFLLSACGSGKKERKEPEAETQNNNLLQLTAEQVKANNLVLGQCGEFEFTRKTGATGYFEALPRNIRTVTIWEGGTINNLNLIPGDYVKAGQSLFSIENPGLLQLQEDYLSASEWLKYLKDEYERQKLLASENVAAQKVLLKAESEYLGTKARVDALKAKLSLLRIDPDKIKNGIMVSSVQVTAPISGYITNVEGNNGKYVSEQSEILEIVETSPLMLNLSVFGKDIIKVCEGQAVRFTVPDVSDEFFEARIEKVGKILDENHTVTVHALFQSGSRLHFLPGMFVKAEIITGQFNAMALPLTALIRTDDSYFVLVRSNTGDDHWDLARKYVLTGLNDGKMVEILSGSNITSSDQIVLNGAFSLTGY